MKYYCIECNISYTKSDTKRRGIGISTEYYCPTCGTILLSCRKMLKIGYVDSVDVYECDRCSYRFKCWTGYSDWSDNFTVDTWGSDVQV